MEAGLPKIELNFFSTLVAQSGVFIFKDVFYKEMPNLFGRKMSELVGSSTHERMVEKNGLARRLDCLTMVEQCSREANRRLTSKAFSIKFSFCNTC